MEIYSDVKLDIDHLFGKERLEDIQDKIAKATGLAFITVDYKGDPVTEATCFTSFCQWMRKNPKTLPRCKSSDAFGAIQAAVTKKPYVYFCPCGLIEIAIPIVVEGHYLGGFIGGQIRCEDAPKDVSRLANLRQEDDDFIDEEGEGLLKDIPVYTYERFSAIANLVSLIITQLGESEIKSQAQENRMHKIMQELQEKNRQQDKENIEKNEQISELRVRSNPYFLLDALNSALNLSIIEESMITQQYLATLIRFFRYIQIMQGRVCYLLDELDNAERYFQLIQMKYGTRFHYSIKVSGKMSKQKIPSDIIIPFVFNGVFFGGALTQGDISVEIAGFYQDGKAILKIEDNGPGLTYEELTSCYKQYVNNYEGYYLNYSIIYAEEKIKTYFGESGSIEFEYYKGKGRTCIIRWPEYFDERV